MDKTYKSETTFVLDQPKPEAFSAKNHHQRYGVLQHPLKYQWAYVLYETMKNNHWEREDIPMQKDVELWRSSELSDGTLDH